ncbi:MAG TPA: hypothetical protein VFB77_05555, partial [Acidimicrobiales bacterium]|nr:hypothetical protein [Acidimicrobiales bacterium]
PDDPAAPAHPAAPTDTTTTPPTTSARELTRASANGAGAAHPASRRGLVAVLVAVVLVVVLGVGALVVAGAGGEPEVESSRGEDAPVPTTAAPTTTSVPPPSPAEAFSLAAERLEDAGSFGYRGVVSGTDVSAVRPSLWVAVDTTVDGEVELPTGRLHEVAVADSGKAAETVADGSTVWGRSASTVAELAGRGFQRIPALSTAEPATKGVTNLPRWLAGAVGPAAAGVDPQGGRLYHATVPAALIGPTVRGQRAVDATIVLVLDRRHQPAHVEITTLPGGPSLHLALDITGLGTPVGIVPPA